MTVLTYGYDGFMQNRTTVPDGSTRHRKNHQVDGYMTGTNLLVRTDRLSAFIKHATCHSLNGRCIGSKRRFVFRALPIYIRRLTLSFFNFHSENTCQSGAVNLVRANPSSLPVQSVEDEYLLITPTVTYPLLSSVSASNLI